MAMNMSLKVGDDVFVDGRHPAKIVAFVDNDCCEVAWASGVKYGTVVSCSHLQSMSAESPRRRRPTQVYVDETSTEANKKMEATTKSSERVAHVKKIRTRSSPGRACGEAREPPEKVKPIKEPLSRKEAAVQVAVAFQSSKKRKRGIVAMKKRTHAAFAENSAAGPRRNVRARLLGKSDTDKKPATGPRKNATARSKPHAVSENDMDQLISVGLDESHDSSQEIKPKVKDTAPSSFRYHIKDNVWVKDGSTDYPAKVIRDMEDWLEIKYSNGIKDIVRKSAVTMMIDSTDLDGLRSSRRRRCEPTIKNESKKDEKLAQRNKNSSCMISFSV